jgi:hypothetical protein
VGAGYIEAHHVVPASPVTALAAAADPGLPRPDCGERFSVAAEPRCPRCHAVLLDS